MEIWPRRKNGRSVYEKEAETLLIRTVKVGFFFLLFSITVRGFLYFSTVSRYCMYIYNNISIISIIKQTCNLEIGMLLATTDNWITCVKIIYKNMCCNQIYQRKNCVCNQYEFHFIYLYYICKYISRSIFNKYQLSSFLFQNYNRFSKIRNNKKTVLAGQLLNL